MTSILLGAKGSVIEFKKGGVARIDIDGVLIDTVIQYRLDQGVYITVTNIKVLADIGNLMPKLPDIFFGYLGLLTLEFE